MTQRLLVRSVILLTRDTTTVGKSRNVPIVTDTDADYDTHMVAR